MPRDFGLEKLVERQETEERESKERGEKMKGFLEKIAEKLKEEGVPVNSECRIDMDAFKDVFSEKAIAKDKDIVKRWQEEWHPDLTEKEREKKKLSSTGEQMEMLKTLILSKFIGEDFIVVRTSLYDDIKNKIDNIILDRETGNLVCAVDDVGEKEKFEEKRNEIMVRNKKEGGGTLKYGLRLEPKEKKLIKEKTYHIPIFYFALPENLVREGVDKFLSLEVIADNDRKLFTAFKDFMEDQINTLKEETRLDDTLTKRLNNFEKSLKKFKEKTQP